MWIFLCDSAHSKIKNISKRIPVYSHEGWGQNQPTLFKVTIFIHKQFLNCNPQHLSFVKKFKFADAVWIQYRKSNVNVIFCKAFYKDGGFQILSRKTKK